MLTGFLSFYSKMIYLGRVFMQSLWEFVAKFPPGRPCSRRTISRKISDNLSWWNNSTKFQRCSVLQKQKAKNLPVVHERIVA